MGLSLEFSLHLCLFALLFREVLKFISGVLAFFSASLPLLPPSWFSSLFLKFLSLFILLQIMVVVRRDLVGTGTV